jgi:hypothetical protein
MKRSSSETAKILGVKLAQLKSLAWVFKDHLSSSANPPKTHPRLFSEEDLLALIFVNHYWEDNPDIEAIKIGLYSCDHHEDAFVEELYKHTPLIQELPEDLDETWRHGIMLGGRGRYHYLEFARHYRSAAEFLLQSALERDDLDGWAYPVLFAYRHTLELYLKLIGEIDVVTHSLVECMNIVEKRYSAKFKSPARDWILEMDRIDPSGTAFRYSDVEPGTSRDGELWFDFVHFRFAMKQVFEALDRIVLHLQPEGKPVKKRKSKSRQVSPADNLAPSTHTIISSTKNPNSNRS